MPIAKYILSLIFIIYLQNIQEKEIIYILFDKSNGDKCIVSNKIITFSLSDQNKININSQHKINYFEYDSLIHDKKIVLTNCIKDKLITGIEATSKVDKYLNSTSPNRFITPYYYNSYFKEVYIFEKITDSTGCLYEVNWKWYTK